MNRVKYGFFLLMMLLLQTAAVQCREFPMLHYTIDDGLPSNTIYQIYRDSKGFIWVATDKGVARHNGIRFEVYTTFNGLPDNEIFFFKEDKKGRLWLGTFNGALCYFKEGVFHTAANTPFLQVPTISEHIRLITLEQDGSVLVLFGDRSKFIDINGEQCNFINLDQLNNAEIVKSLIYVKKLSDKKYKLYCKDRVIIIDDIPRIINSEPVGDIVTSHEGYAMGQDQIYLYNEHNYYTDDTRIFEQLPTGVTVSNLHAIFRDGGRTFFSTTEGVVVNDLMQILKGNNITSVITDLNDNYWVSTLNAGIYVLSNDFYNTRVYKNVYADVAKYAYAYANDLFFVTSYNNLHHIKGDKTTILFNYQNFKKEKYKVPNQPGFLIDSNYHFYSFYNDDYIYFDNLLSGKPVVKRNSLKDGLKAVFATDRYIYLKGSAQIFRMDLAKNNDKDVKFDMLKNNAPNERIFGIAKDADNNIWYSTVNNIYKIVGEERVQQPQFRNMAFKNIEFIGQYLVGYTHDNLLLICGNINGRVTVDSVLSQNCIWDRFYKLDPFHLLISTNEAYRLLSIGKDSKGPAYTVSAVQNAFIPLQAEAICSDGRTCYFLKNSSVTAMNIASITKKAEAPRLFYTFLKTGKGSYRIRNAMQISYQESKNISISFMTVSLGGKDVAYQYSLTKNDQDNWRDIKSEEINLINSGSGKYTIKVRARSPGGDYSVPIVFTMQVPAPYWATWWFITLSVCAAVGLVALFVRLRILYVLHKKERRHNDEIKYMKSEYKALNALMNPHFIFNTLNNVQSLFNENDKRAANEYLRVFADLVRQNMHNISQELIPLEKEVTLVTNYLRLEKLRFEDKLVFEIDVDNEVDLSDIMVPPLLIQPLVENSIKHGILPMKSGQGVIRMRIFEKNGVLHIHVKDNGVGLAESYSKKDEGHESFGLENIRKRIAQLSIIQNKEISFDMTEEHDHTGKLLWTIVAISIPVSD